jgi:hypothetical protein
MKELVLYNAMQKEDSGNVDWNSPVFCTARRPETSIFSAFPDTK